MRCMSWEVVSCALVVGAVLSGCATAPPGGRADTSALQRISTVVTTGQGTGNIRVTKEWTDAFNAANAQCEKQSQAYEALTQAARDNTFALASLGVIATSIVAPSFAARQGVGKATAAAAGGLSGAAGGILSANDKSGASAVALSTAYTSFKTELDSRTAFLKETPASVDVDFGRLRSLELWCASAAPNPAASQIELMQKTQQQQRELIEHYKAFTQQQQTFQQQLFEQQELLRSQRR